MKTPILMLICDDIKLTSLAKTLTTIGWAVENLSTNNLSVINHLMNIEPSDLVSDWYYQAVSKQMTAESIYDWLDEITRKVNLEQ
jgi:hypothetical protein